MDESADPARVGSKSTDVKGAGRKSLVSEPESAKKLTRIQRQRRAEILEAALEVFSKDGFRGASINQISECAQMSTPRLLYHFPDKKELYRALLESTLLLWMGPLERLGDAEDPVEEICDYVRHKLEMSRDYPRESRLFAGEVLMGVRRSQITVFEPFRKCFDEKIALLESWVKQGRISAQDPHHLIYSIWATTQHYADFDAQIGALSPGKMDRLYPDAEAFLVPMYRKLLTPQT